MASETTTPNTKVARVIEAYDLDGMGESMEAAWTGETGERTSLRDLADEFNEAVLEAALRDAGTSSVAIDTSSMYETLQGDSGSETTRTRRRLEREGIDPDELSEDFVTHQAIHTYLTKDREASFSVDTDGLTDRKTETIEKLQGRVSAVTESAISSLANAGELDQDGYDVIVDVRAICPNCGSDSAISELIRRGGCDCTTETTDAH